MIWEPKIRRHIEAALAPTHLEIVNESPSHGLAPEAEKHFRVVVVSARFQDLARVERHRLVHQAVVEELREHIHALSVQAYTPDEWQTRGEASFTSPACLGGGKHEGKW